MAKSKKNAQIDAGNALTIENISRIKNDFDTLIDKSNEVEIVSKKMEAIDLTGVQLLTYIQQQAEKNKKTVRFALKLNDEQTKMLERCGFDQTLEYFK